MIANDQIERIVIIGYVGDIPLVFGYKIARQIGACIIYVGSFFKFSKQTSRGRKI
jgi:hypothetical protein